MLVHRSPNQRGGATLSGNETQPNRAVAIRFEFGPIHRHYDFLPLCNNVGYPVRKKGPDVELLIAEQAIRLLDAMLRFEFMRLGKTLSKVAAVERPPKEEHPECIVKKRPLPALSHCWHRRKR
jgi:hypothetical protein